MPALETWGRSMLTDNGASWKGVGKVDGSCKTCKDGRTKRKERSVRRLFSREFLRPPLRRFLSVRETAPGLKSPVLQHRSNVHLDMCRASADDAVSKLHPGLHVVVYLLPGKMSSRTPAGSSRPQELASQACLRVCSVVPNLDRPTPPPEGPPSIPQAPVQPSPGPTKSLQVQLAAAGVHRLPIPMPMLTHQRSFIHTLLRTASFRFSLLPSSRLSF